MELTARLSGADPGSPVVASHHVCFVDEFQQDPQLLVDALVAEVIRAVTPGLTEMIKDRYTAETLRGRL